MGCIQLIKSIIHSMYVYSFHVYIWPNKLLKTLDHWIKNFLWRRIFILRRFVQWLGRLSASLGILVVWIRSQQGILIRVSFYSWAKIVFLVSLNWAHLFKFRYFWAAISNPLCGYVLGITWIMSYIIQLRLLERGNILIYGHTVVLVLH